MTICSYAQWEFVLGEDGGMVVDAEGQVVGNKILGRGSDVDRIKVLEFVFKSISFFLGQM